MRIQLIYDVRGWAWHHKALAIADALKKDFDEVRPIAFKKFKQNYSEYKHYRLHAFGWQECLKWARRATCGISSHNYEKKHLDKAKRRLKEYRGVTATSKMLYDGLRKRKLNKNIFYCPNGVDEKKFPFMKMPQKFAVGWMGQPTHLPYDQHGYMSIYLPLKKKLTEAGIEIHENIGTHKNAKPHNEMPEYYKKISVLLHTGKMTGTPNPAFEAASCGRAIVSTPIGAIPEFIDGNGYIDKTVDGLFERIRQLMVNYDMCREMGERSRELVEKRWTWKERARAWIEPFLL